jgi:hypothetical protein
LIKTGKPAWPFHEHVAVELLIDEIVSHRLPQDGLPDAGQKLSSLICEVDRLDVVEEIGGCNETSS